MNPKAPPPPGAPPGLVLSAAEVTETTLDAMTFDGAFEVYAPFVWHVLALLGVATADVPDVCQEVFLVLHRRWDSVDLKLSLKGWLYAVCTRKVSEHRRRRGARPEVITAEPPEGRVEGGGEDALDRQRAMRLLMAALDRLTDEQRAIFVLYELEGFSLAEAAATLGCPLQTVYSRLRAARALVCEAFGRVWMADGGVANGRQK